MNWRIVQQYRGGNTKLCRLRFRHQHIATAGGFLAANSSTSSTNVLFARLNAFGTVAYVPWECGCAVTAIQNMLLRLTQRSRWIQLFSSFSGLQLEVDVV
jgi:hypothetical protein